VIRNVRRRTMTSLRISWKHFLGLAFSIIYPSTAIFKKVGYLPMLAYILAAVCLLLLVVWLAQRTEKILTQWVSFLGLSLLLVSVLIAHFLIHPQIDTDGFHLAGISFGSSDADNAIDDAIGEVLNGRYPYYVKTFLGNPITPMPGALILALPFYFLGMSTVQNVFWLTVVFAIIAAYYRSIRISSLLAFSVFFLSPNVLYHVLQGGDYIANSIYILTFCAGLLESVRHRAPAWQSVLCALLLGIGLSSRMNYIVILPLILSGLVKTGSVKEAMLYSSITLLAFSMITVPFILYDPFGFSPLHTANKLSLGGVFRWAPVALPLFAGILASALALGRKTYSLPVFMMDVTLTQIVLMVGGLALASLRRGELALEYPHFGIMFLFFGVFAFGPATLTAAEILTRPCCVRR
jgi:hypothetical protein